MFWLFWNIGFYDIKQAKRKRNSPIFLWLCSTIKISMFYQNTQQWVISTYIHTKHCHKYAIKKFKYV